LLSNPPKYWCILIHFDDFLKQIVTVYSNVVNTFSILNGRHDEKAFMSSSADPPECGRHLSVPSTHVLSPKKQDRTLGLKCRQVNTAYFMSRIIPNAFGIWSCLPFILCN